jgi:ABC-2 type transport system permease protein
VLSKVLVALVVVPVGVFLLTLVTDLVVALVVAVSVNGGAQFWDTGTWIKLRAAMIPGLAIVLLWYAPIAGYLILVSTWARRNLYLWAALPPFLLILIENRAFGTHYVTTYLMYRLTGVWKHFGTGVSLSAWHNGVPPIGPLLESVGATQAFTDIDLWAGLIVAGLLIFAGIRIRRFRDDT